MNEKKKEQLIEGARIAGAQPNDFWKQVEKRIDIRDKHKQIKPRPVVKN